MDGPAVDEQPLLRAGAVLGIVGAIGAVGINAFHPRLSSDSLNDIHVLLSTAAKSHTWRGLHLAGILITIVAMAGAAALLRSMALDGAGHWPLIAFVSSFVTGPLVLFSLSIDGFAIKAVADQWTATAAGADRDGLFNAAVALRSLDITVLSLIMVGYFGVTAVLTGVATWKSASYGPWVALPALAGGVTGFASGTLMALSGRETTVSYLVLLTVSLGLFTLWLLVASAMLWHGLAVRHAAGTRPPAPVA
jgi:hypothetical protein